MQHMRIRFIVLGVLCGAALSVLFGGRAEAVQLKLVPAVGRHAIGGEFAVDVKIDTEEKAINAAQATIVFPPHLLEVKEVSREGSLFTFWLDEPRFANEKGTVQFVGGTHTGISGGSIQVTRIVFMTKRSGTALVSFEEAAVTASDGSGTNILTALHGAQFVLVEDAGGPAPPPPPALAP
ncbi:MAG: hypothetical protein HY436_00330, partial [Candidatus Liptonbacteria bacterium]|nr:hypothetical protein [Candidatus Liptonbacteria bacterium]